MLRISREQQITIVEFGKSYDSLDLQKLDEARSSLLDEADHAEPPLVVLDFARTTFIGSSFIELLVRAWKRLKQRGGLMTLCNLNPFCEEVFHVSRLDLLWQICPSRQAAIDALRENPRDQ
jgi:anti-sigma B factor antagonist